MAYYETETGQAGYGIKETCAVNRTSEMDKLQHYPDNTDRHIEHPSLAKPGIHVYPDKLYVVTMLSDPLRWRARYANYWTFEKECKAAGVELYTCEIAFGGRQFEVTQANDPKDLQLRTTSEIWQKENALNLMVERLPVNAKYIAWIDADVQFARPDWAQETLHQLQHYDVVQMFSHAQDVGPDFEPVGQIQPGFMFKYVTDRPDFHDEEFSAEKLPYPYYGRKIGHPGYAWAARRDALDSLGMLIDFAILGSADYHMAMGLIGQIELTLAAAYPPAYKRMCAEWQSRAEKYIMRNVGYVPGSLNHYWHGRKVDRKYDDRWKLLGQSGYDPELDLKRDWQGLFQLTDRNRVLRDGLRQYNRLRNEDSVAV